MPARILLVEDEEPLLLLLRYNLEAEGYAVDTATQGDEAVLKIEQLSESASSASEVKRRSRAVL